MDEIDPKQPFLTFSETVVVLGLIALIAAARACQWAILCFRRSVEGIGL